MQTLSEVSPFQRDRVAAQLMQPGYVRKLLELFSVRNVSAPQDSLDVHVAGAASKLLDGRVAEQIEHRHVLRDGKPAAGASIDAQL
jgi:hypothetical protein